jgi:aryl sulfotransferase
MGARVRYKHLMFDSDRWDGFEFRPDDIVISTPPKCGTTWTQMICALVLFQTTSFDRPLDLISPWLDMQTRPRADIVADLEAQTHRRFMKTHTPLDGIPWEPTVTYIAVGRDPRDVAVSWDHHLANMDMVKMFTARQNAVGLDDIADRLAAGPPEFPDNEVDRFWRWVDDDTSVYEGHTLKATLHHLQTFWDVRDRENIMLLHYDDLTRDLEAEMRDLAARLDVTVADAKWPALVEAARFEQMKDRADLLTPESSADIWKDNTEFFHAGRSGQWRALCDDADMDRYFARVAELAPPDFAAWVHGGKAARTANG